MLLLHCVCADKAEIDFMSEARKIGKKGDITLRVASSEPQLTAAARAGLQGASMEELKALVERVGAKAQLKRILNIG